MKRIMFLLSVFALSIVILYGAENNSAPMMRKGHRMPAMQRTLEVVRLKLKEELNLTDEQLKKIEDLKMANDLKRQKLDLKIEKINIDIKEEMLNDSIDFNKIRVLIKKINDLELKKKYLKIDFLEKVQKILSKEQFRKFIMLTEKFRKAVKMNFMKNNR